VISQFQITPRVGITIDIKWRTARVGLRAGLLATESEDEAGSNDNLSFGEHSSTLEDGLN
jgi:hypothetical protein